MLALATAEGLAPAFRVVWADTLPARPAGTNKMAVITIAATGGFDRLTFGSSISR